MAQVLRLPITISSGNCYTLDLLVGSQATPVTVLLDTGSSMSAVNIDVYDPGADAPAATTTDLLQSGSFQGAASFLAAVVQTPVGLQADGATPVTVPKANLGVVYKVQPFLFGKADGILGLAYPALNAATRMPANTWDNKYTPAQLGPGQAAGTLAPCVNQLAAAGEIANKFAIAVRRSTFSQGPDAAVLNTGVFVLGGGEECTELYTGAFSTVAVMGETYYNTNLVAVQVDGRTIQVGPPPAGSDAASNSFLDSGSNQLILDPPLYQQVIAMFNEVDPAFGAALQAGSHDQTQLDLTAWPTLEFVLAGVGGAQATWTVEPKDYWQFDGYGAGTARTGLASGSAPHPGQSILGLPLFANHYVVFDRTAGPGRSVIRFAPQPAAEAAPLVA
jgi:hypothetical protein